MHQVSNLGKIRSLNYKRSWKEKILSLIKLDEYSRIKLYKKPYLVHRLVAIHFIPNPLKLPCVLHKDETLDERWLLYNWVDNLWWWTAKDNTRDMVNKWRQWKQWKFWSECNNAKKVLQYSNIWELIKEWWSIIDIVRTLWLTQSSLSQCCNWKRRSTGWFIWKFKI